jgi:hypothetical protein
MYFRICIIFSLLVFTSATATLPTALPDQFGGSASLNDYAGQPVLVIVASGRKLRWIGKWEKNLRAKVPELVSLRVADITDDPKPAETEVAAVLRERAPPGISILIDMQNQWATDFQLDTGEPCLLLFDAEHNVVAKFRGRPRDPLFTEVVTALRAQFPASPGP